MMRTPCCENMGLKKGPWTPEEDEILISHVQQFGHDNWRALPMQAGLQRCGKSCRLRWTNYLRPDIKRGNFSVEEEETITKLHALIGNRWSAIAAKLPGRTDNEIKNFWHTRIKKKRDKTPAFQHNVESYVETTPAEVSNHMRSSLSNAEVSNHMRSSSLSNAEVSTNEISHDFWSSKYSSYNYNNINVIQSSSLTTEIQGVTDCRNQFLSPKGTTKEAMDDNNSIVNNDMVFWYDLLMKSGDTQN